MKRFAVVALGVLVGLAVSAFGQRGGHGGGFGGHGFGGSVGAFHGGGFSAPHFSGSFSAPRVSGGFSAPRFSGGFAPHISRGFNGPRFSGYRSSHYQPRYRSFPIGPIGPRSGFGSSSGGNHSGSHHSGGHHHGGITWSITTVPNVATLVPGWIGFGPYGYYPYGYDYGWDDPPSSPDYAANAAPQNYDPPPEQEQPVYREQYEPPAAPLPTAIPANQSVTTIVFNDGRPSEQVRNYALTPTTLYVLDAQRQNIPLDQINIAATQQVNRATGVDFQVPRVAQ